MRIFLVFMFSLFLFGCGADSKYSKSMNEIIKYQVGDNITAEQMEKIGLTKQSIDFNRDQLLLVRSAPEVYDLNTVWLDTLITANDTIQVAIFKFTSSGREKFMDEYPAELKRYLQEEFNAELKFINRQNFVDKENTIIRYMADIKGAEDMGQLAMNRSKNLGKVVFSLDEFVFNDGSILYEGSIFFMTDEMAARVRY